MKINTQEPDRFQENALADLNRMLDSEMAKPEKERDYKKIREITECVSAVMGDEADENRAIGQGYQKLMERMNRKPFRFTGILRTAACFGCVLCVALGANLYSSAAYNMNLFSLIAHISEEGKPPENTRETQPVTEANDPFGLRVDCEMFGLDVKVPYYLPDGFQLTGVDSSNKIDYRTIEFTFRREAESVVLRYTSPSKGQETEIPENAKEKELGGITGTFLHENDSMLFVYYEEEIEYVVRTEGIAEDELARILASVR